MDFAQMAGVLGGILTLGAFVPYILSILKGKSRPSRTTWLIWAVLGLILLSSYYAVGATDTLWVPLGFQIGYFIVLWLSIRHGEGNWDGFDRWCLIGAGMGLLLWWIFDSPLTALVMSMSVDVFGAMPTMRKAWDKPESEDIRTWFLLSLGNGINIFAVRQWTFEIAAFPVYLFLSALIIFSILLIRKNFKPAKRS